jgi:hypothetical protein
VLCRAADFDGFMRGANKKAHKEHTKVRSFSVPPKLEGGASGMNPHHIHKLLAIETPKWHSLTANEFGRTFGERNSAAMGANLFRHEHEASMQQKMRTVDAVLRAYGGEGSDALAASLQASRSMLPLLNPRGSKLKMGAGYIKVDLLAEDAGIYPLRGISTPSLDPIPRILPLVSLPYASLPLVSLPHASFPLVSLPQASHVGDSIRSVQCWLSLLSAASLSVIHSQTQTHTHVVIWPALHSSKRGRTYTLGERLIDSH